MPHHSPESTSQPENLLDQAKAALKAIRARGSNELSLEIHRIEQRLRQIILDVQILEEAEREKMKRRDPVALEGFARMAARNSAQRHMPRRAEAELPHLSEQAATIVALAAVAVDFPTSYPKNFRDEE
jgi:hypothetical protein